MGQNATRAWAAVAIALALAACAGRRKQVAEAPVLPPPVAPTLPTTPRLMSAINTNLSPAATIWHLRTGLNVAALACRGADEAAIIARYNALLAAHKPALAAAETALEAEYKAAAPRDWQDRYDDAMTRLYNFWSRTEAREPFCRTATALLVELQTLDPAALGAFAAKNLPALDAPFATQPTTVLAFAPRLATPTPAAMPLARVPVATTAPAAAPAARRALELDLSTLPPDK